MKWDQTTQLSNGAHGSKLSLHISRLSNFPSLATINGNIGVIKGYLPGMVWMISVLSSRVVTAFLKPHKASVMLMLNFMIRSVKINYFKKPMFFLLSIHLKFPPILVETNNL